MNNFWNRFFRGMADAWSRKVNERKNQALQYAQTDQEKLSIEIQAQIVHSGLNQAKEALDEDFKNK